MADNALRFPELEDWNRRLKDEVADLQRQLADRKKKAPRPRFPKQAEATMRLDEFSDD